MADKYGSERLEQVWPMVLTHTATPSICIIGTVLKNGQETERVQSAESRKIVEAYEKAEISMKWGSAHFPVA